MGPLSRQSFLTDIGQDGHTDFELAAHGTRLERSTASSSVPIAKEAARPLATSGSQLPSAKMSAPAWPAGGRAAEHEAPGSEVRAVLLVSTVVSYCQSVIARRPSLPVLAFFQPDRTFTPA